MGQEFHDEACLSVLNNKYNDGVAWHDVACHFRSVIVCEDSDQLIKLIASQEGTNQIDVDSLPHLPLTAPNAPVRQQFVQPPAASAPQAQFQNQGQFGPGQGRPVRPVRPPQPRPSSPFANL